MVDCGGIVFWNEVLDLLGLALIAIRRQKNSTRTMATTAAESLFRSSFLISLFFETKRTVSNHSCCSEREQRGGGVISEG